MGDCGQVKWITNHENESTSNDVASNVTNPKYSFLGERLRSVTPAALQCSMFCGGRQCKYCNPVLKFKKEDMLIYGLYSAWVTDKILATSRPSSEAMKQFNIISQFHSHGITSIINLQHAGEHTACGFGLETSGFSYNPEEFMDSNIFFYNFGWNDYGVRSLQSILDMVQVMDFAVLNGKAAIHCHAGLGRTGVLIACYIIFSNRSSAPEAICKVRQSRPRSIQTRGQINCVKDFAAYIKPMWIIFAEEDSRISLQHFLNRQRRLLHGEEAKTLRYIPKIVFTILQRLLQLACVQYDLTCCVKVTHHNFMQKCSFITAPQANINDFVDVSQGEANCTKSIMDDHLCLQKHNTEIIPSRTLSNEVEMQMKAVSMPNVAFAENIEETISKHKHRKLKPLKLNHTKRKKNEVKEKLLNLHEKSDDLSLGSSFNSYLETDCSLSLSSSLDTSLYFRQCSIVSDTSFLSESLNNGLSSGEEVVKYLAFRTSDVHVYNQVERFKHKLNAGNDAWGELREETNMAVLSGLLWLWLKCLQGPIVTIQQIEVMKSHIAEPQNAGDEVQKGVWKLIEGFVTCLSKLHGRNDDVNRALRRFAVTVTGDDSIPRIKFYQRKMENELNGNESHGYIFLKFLLSLLDKLKST